MTRQHTTSQSLKSIAGAALVGLGLVILFGNLDGAAAQLSHLLGTAAGKALGVLPSVAPAVWQDLQTYAFDHQRFSLCPLQMLVSFWPLLQVMVGAV